jgi:streptogramin lyase
MLRQLAILALLPLTTFVACGGDGDTTSDDGSAGEPGAAGETGTGGSGGCAETGKGSVTVEVVGLPSGVEADVTLEGPDGEEIATESLTLDDLTSGTYTARAARVTDDDPIVRTVFDPNPVVPASFCLKIDGSQTVTVTYEAIPSSNKLWTENQNGDFALAAFASELLGETYDGASSVTIGSPAGRDIAFDVDGNLWSIGPTTAETHLVRYPAAVLGVSGEPERDRNIDIDGIPCGPSVRALAFDMDGNLWVSTCGDQVVRLVPGDLAADGTAMPEVVLSGITDNGNIAFDADGNLWVVTVATETSIARYDAARLGASDGDAPDRLLTVTNPDDTNLLTPTDLVFDAAGDLWVTDFGGNLVFRVAAADLAGTGEETVAAAVRLTIGVSALIDRPVFDESGGLFIGLGGGGIGRLSPEQLAVSTTAGDPTDPEVIITSADLGSVGRIGFYPAARDLPLFHAVP